MQPYSNSLSSTACQVNKAHSGLLAKAKLKTMKSCLGFY